MSEQIDGIDFALAAFARRAWRCLELVREVLGDVGPGRGAAALPR